MGPRKKRPTTRVLLAGGGLVGPGSVVVGTARRVPALSAQVSWVQLGGSAEALLSGGGILGETMFDPTTAAAYLAAPTATLKAEAVRDALGAALTAEIYAGATLLYSGTFTGPLVASAGSLSVDVRPTGTATGSGTPNASTWKLRISGNGRWMDGALGTGGQFALASLTTGQIVRIDIVIAPRADSGHNAIATLVGQGSGVVGAAYYGIPPVIENTLTISNPTGSTLTNYPLQFGRAFAVGEVAQHIQVYADGSPLTTQVDEKNRWGDGSLKFAVISVVIPSMAPATNITLSLVPSAPASNTPVTRASMLADYDFDATVTLSGGGTGSASAWTMLAAASDASLAANTTAHAVNSRYWTKGPVCTTVILCDHTTKTYDFGTTAHKSLRPIFHVQFWPTLGIYKVRYIVEQSDTTKIQNQTYDVTLRAGYTSPAVRYTKSAVGHVYGSRWTKEFWVGVTIPLLNIKHNVGYLASTRVIPNYDPTVAVDTTGSNNVYFSKAWQVEQWASKSKDIYDAGWWEKAMWAPNGEIERGIGLFPAWHASALYEGSATMWEIARTQTDLAGAWPLHFRVGDVRSYDVLAGGAGQGRVTTRDTHPTQWTGQGNGYMNTYYVSAGDLFTEVGARSNSGWDVDGAHHPDPWYLMYLTTGEPWFLEELQFSASWGTFNCHKDYGPDPKWAFIQEQPRGDAWQLRNRARAGFISPDGSPEKGYFNRVTEYALRAFEGKRIGTGADPIRAYWATDTSDWGRILNNPLHYWESNPTAGGARPADAKSVCGQWMYSYLTITLGHVKELGYTAGEMLTFAAKFQTGLATDAGAGVQFLSAYQLPNQKLDGSLFQTWLDALDDPWVGDTKPTVLTVNDHHTHSYGRIGMCALSFATNETNGAASWAAVAAKYESLRADGGNGVWWGTNQQWAILPRT